MSTQLGITLALGLAVLIALCWFWMKGTRASQRRQDEHNARVLRLLEEQNDILRRLVDKP